MKTKIVILLIAVAFLSFGLYGTSYAFHSGGVAECEGCHTMHNTKSSGKGVPYANGVGVGAPYLLQGSDQSSTCMNCHNPVTPDTAPSSYHIASDGGAAIANAPIEMTPGGDFAWLKKTYTFVLRGNTGTNDGNAHGHNVVAVDYGYGVDPDNSAAPGGTYPAANLGCNSCHNPHSNYRIFADGSLNSTGLPIANSGSYNNSAAPLAGKLAVGVYRILGGANYTIKSASYTFSANPPAALAPSTYNRSEATTQTNVVYGTGMSEWCGNCHGAMVENTYVSGASGHRHPAGSSATLTAPIVANYNAYVSSGIMTNTGASYNTLAPFEQGFSYGGQIGLSGSYKSYAVNGAPNAALNATTSGNVMCLSCHRAHASGFPEITRFFLEGEMMTSADPAGNALYGDPTVDGGKYSQGLPVADQTAAYYGRPATTFGPYARNFCNKCHAKD